ncbi:MAG: S41 family peptidase [Clostridium sp.]|jgi:carboxyl-terminal processing protease|nr:S41 family peptidase [Clostridium sp.]MEE0127502.1 S41 family peptidase [Clostridia bacterium]
MKEKDYSKSIFIKSIILTILLTTVIVSMVTIIIMNNNEQTSLLNRIDGKLSSIEQIVDKDYLGEIDENKIFDETIKGYVEGLNDEYSQYFTKEELDKYKTDNIEGQFVGIGVYIIQDTEKNAIRVLAPIKGSPAEKAGILAGDYIVKVDDQAYTGEQITEATNKMKGKEGTKVKIQIIRDEKNLDFEVERANVRVNPVEADIYEENIGYLKISSFDQGSGSEVTKKVEELKEKNIKSLMIDLRNNGGGIVDEAIEIADLFTNKDSTLLITKDKHGNENISKAKKDKVIEVPIIVLTNENTASASEILAGALKDNNVAKIVGTTTFGKGVIQELLTMKDGTGLKLTTNEYYTPNRNKINKVGIEPDEKIELPEEYKNILSIPKEVDTQLNKAIELLKR